MKNCFLIKTTHLILLLIIVYNASAQTVTTDVAGNYSAEKIYIHYDKPYYAAGETIWFKAYLYNNRLPSVSNHTFYLHVLDTKGKIIDAKKYPVNAATVKGSINIPDTLEEGYYTIRAVTPASANDNEFIYSKNIFIYNPALKSKMIAPAKKVSIQFFPESGNLVDSIFTEVGFKATDEYGNPVEVSGLIKSGNDAIVAKYKTTHNGMGRFTLKPKFGQKYYAEADINGQTFTYPLPAVQESGIYLMVSNEENGKVYDLARNSKTPVQNVNLIVRLNNTVVFETPVAFNKELILRGHLNTKDLPSGILQFSVLGTDGLPLAERLTFVNNGEFKRDPVFQVTQASTDKRGKNSFTVQFPPDIQTSLSVSVTDAAVQSFPDKENIYSRLLLSGDLRGYIYDPAWYFQNNDLPAKEALDNLLMIHGWSKYNIKRMPATNKKLNDKYLLELSGIVNDAKTGTPVSKGSLTFGIVSEDSTTQQVKIPVDNSGRFIMDSLLVYGKAKVYYTYRSDGGKENKVIIVSDKVAEENVFYAENTSERPALTIPLKDPIYQQPGFAIQVKEKVKLLPEVVATTKTSRPKDNINEKYATSLYRSSGKVILDNINNPYSEGTMSVVDYIKTNISSIEQSGSGFVSRKNFSIGTGGSKWRVETLLNEFPTAISTIAAIRMRDVALIKHYEAGFTGAGSGGPGGAVAIYLKKDEDGAPAVPQMEAAKYIPFQGYSVTKEFYNPDYSVADPGHAAADKRITLFWNPDASTSSATPVNINFYNNDISKRFQLVIEGIDNTGKLIHYEKIIGN